MPNRVCALRVRASLDTLPVHSPGLQLALLCAVALSSGCPGPGPHLAADAAIVSSTPDSGAASPDAGGADGGEPPSVWPNAVSYRTSDAWLRAHHDEIAELRPRILALHFANGTTVEEALARFELQRAAMSEATRYHGYSDPSAQPFLTYELAQLVDLTDNPVPSGWTAPNSTQMPRRNGGIDFGALFSQQYADLYGISDPNNPAHSQTLCELMARGFFQELWIVFNKTGSDSNVPEILEYKQVYDAQDAPVPGQFDSCAGNGCVDPADLPAISACGTSLRIGFLEMTGVIGNSLHVNSHNYEHMGWVALPHFWAMYQPFGNFDLQERFSTPFTSWYDACDYGATDCIQFTDGNSLNWQCDSQLACWPLRGTMTPYNQGCGNAHFPPNGRYQYDYYNTSGVLSRCEHYGLGDGPDGGDLQTPYDASKAAPYEPTYGSGVGGGWHIYSFQNFPGHGNKSKMSDGTPMKNWWPYLYY